MTIDFSSRAAAPERRWHRAGMEVLWPLRHCLVSGLVEVGTFSKPFNLELWCLVDLSAIKFWDARPILRSSKARIAGIAMSHISSIVGIFVLRACR